MYNGELKWQNHATSSASLFLGWAPVIKEWKISWDRVELLWRDSEGCWAAAEPDACPPWWWWGWWWWWWLQWSRWWRRLPGIKPLRYGHCSQYSQTDLQLDYPHLREGPSLNGVWWMTPRIAHLRISHWGAIPRWAILTFTILVDDRSSLNGFWWMTVHLWMTFKMMLTSCLGPLSGVGCEESTANCLPSGLQATIPTFTWRKSSFFSSYKMCFHLALCHNLSRINPPYARLRTKIFHQCQYFLFLLECRHLKWPHALYLWESFHRERMRFRSRWSPARNCLCLDTLCTAVHRSQPESGVKIFIEKKTELYFDLPESGSEAGVPACQKIWFRWTPSKCSHTSSKVFQLLSSCVQLKVVYMVDTVQKPNHNAC